MNTTRVCQNCFDAIRPTDYFPESQTVDECATCADFGLVARITRAEAIAFAVEPIPFPEGAGFIPATSWDTIEMARRDRQRLAAHQPAIIVAEPTAYVVYVLA